MQKVVGSSPIIRFTEPAGNGGFLYGPAGHPYLHPRSRQPGVSLGLLADDEFATSARPHTLGWARGQRELIRDDAFGRRRRLGGRPPSLQ